jgi:hypothetical protein
MSSYEFTSESSTDEEFEQSLLEVEEEKIRDAQSHELWDLMDRSNISSPLNGPMDGYTLNECLYPKLKMEDVVYKNFLRYDGQVALHDRITLDRIQEFRRVAKALAEHYTPAAAKFTSYINGVTAHLIKYHYKL